MPGADYTSPQIQRNVQTETNGFIKNFGNKLLLTEMFTFD
jgi:hypothetical protein